MLVFPSSFFNISAKDVDIETARISGGTALSGVEDVIATDGGGRWYAEAGDVPLWSRERILAWRAFNSATGGGIDPFVFPICDIRHQPTLGRTLVPHSDGASFSDDSLYLQGDCTATTTASAALRATTLQLSIALGKTLIGGERFSIDHPTWRHRAYQIGRVIAQTATTATVQFHPPAREAIASGTPVDFNSPRFVARVDGRMSAPMSNPKFASGAVRFVEDMTGSYA